jgi:hypothetical protein
VVGPGLPTGWGKAHIYASSRPNPSRPTRQNTLVYYMIARDAHVSRGREGSFFSPFDTVGRDLVACMRMRAGLRIQADIRSCSSLRVIHLIFLTPSLIAYLI